jgi:hypothetical protein
MARSKTLAPVVENTEPSQPPSSVAQFVPRTRRPGAWLALSVGSVATTASML